MLVYQKGDLLLARGQTSFTVNGREVWGHMPEHVVGSVKDGKKTYYENTLCTYTKDGSPVYNENGQPRKLLNGLAID